MRVPQMEWGPAGLKLKEKREKRGRTDIHPMPFFVL